MSKTVPCRSLSSIHILYNQALVGGLSDTFDPAPRIANVSSAGGSIRIKALSQSDSELTSRTCSGRREVNLFRIALPFLSKWDPVVAAVKGEAQRGFTPLRSLVSEASLP